MTFQIREAVAADAPGIRRLFSRVFGAEMAAAEWDWKFASNPDGWLGTVAILDGEVVGNYAGWAMRFRLEGEERLLYSVGDVATDQSVRALGGRRGVYRLMVGPTKAPTSTMRPMTKAQVKPARQALMGSPVARSVGSMTTKTQMKNCGTLGP